MAQVEPRPGGGRPRPGMDYAVSRFSRFVLRILFREFEMIDADYLPATGPVIVIANHYNSLMDGAILLSFLPRIPRFLAASTVWDYKPVAPFMNASGAVKVFRQQDGRAHEGSLEDSFSEAAQLLADGGVLAVFPEGRTHDAPALLPFKTGTARIARFTQERHGPLDLAIVPLGVDYEVKNLVRTRACFTFGPPVSLGTEAGANAARDGKVDKRGEEGREVGAFRAATGRLRQALSAVAPDFKDADEALALTLGGEILALEPGERGAASGRPPAFSRIVTARRALHRALADDSRATDGAALRAALDAYGTGLRKADLADHELAAPPTRAALTRSLLALLPGLPLALVALVFNLPQALTLRAVSRSKPRDRQMTWVAFGSLVIYPLSWALWAIVLGLAAAVASGGGVGGGWDWGWGWGVGLATLLGAPLSGKLALPTIDRALRVGRAVRARRLFNRDPGLADRLRALRHQARSALDALGVAIPPDRSR